MTISDELKIKELEQKIEALKAVIDINLSRHDLRIKHSVKYNLKNHEWYSRGQVNALKEIKEML